MKSKPAKKTAKTAPQNATKKVFDVTRPGKTPVSPTSRPVIVGHKPQVKDPMMSDRDDDRPMLDSSKKVTIQPAAGAAALPPTQDTGPAAHGGPSSANDADASSAGSLPTASPATDAVREPARSSEALANGNFAESELAGGSTDTKAGPASDDSAPDEAATAPETPEAEKPAEPSTADSVATIATSSVVDDVPPPQPAAAEPKPAANNNTTSGLVFDELDGADPDLTKPATAQNADSSLPPTDSDSAKLPLASASLEQVGSRTETETHEPAVVGQAVVSHHKQAGSAGKVFVVLFVLLILAIVAFDILLDMGILNMTNLPHTNFLPSN